MKISFNLMASRTFLFAGAAFFIAGLVSASAGTFTFSNTNAIVINDSASPPPPTAASPYPAPIQVTNLNGSIITKVTVQLTGFAHGFPDDVDIVLVGPEGQNVVLMGNTGSETRSPVTNIDLTLDDDAASNLPLDSALVSGTFKPTQRNAFIFDFPAPAPKSSDLMGTLLGNFKNTEPNGTWSLFVVDDTNPDSGVITGGWSLSITTTPVLLSIAQAQTNAVLSWTNAAAGYTLQATHSLAPAVWANVGIAPVNASGYFTVTNAVTNSPVFYRLAK